MSRRAFTLVELLVVISIIGLLSTIAIVSMSGARDKARLASGQQLNGQIARTIGDALTGSWSFDECSGATVSDRSGNGNTGTVNGATFSATTPTKTGCSLSFNGASDVTATGPTYPNGVTISLWMNTTNIGAQQCLFGQNVGGANFLNIWMPGNGTVRFETALSSSFYSNKALVANTWYNIIASYDPASTTGKAKIYIDGALDKATDTTWSGGSASNTIRIGSFLAGQYFFNGYIDDVRVYSNPLVASEVYQLYAEGKPRHAGNLAER